MCAPLIPKFVVRTSRPAQCADVRSAIDVSCFRFVQIFEHLRRFSIAVFSLFDALRATPQLSKSRNPFKEVFGRRLFCEIAPIGENSPCYWPRALDAGSRAQRRQDAKTQRRRAAEEREMMGMGRGCWRY
jgi:hypothetical protein